MGFYKNQLYNEEFYEIEKRIKNKLFSKSWYIKIYISQTEWNITYKSRLDICCFCRDVQQKLYFIKKEILGE